MSYTKGEWHLDILDGEILANGTRIAKVYGATNFNRSQTSIECMANARLILNAPTMLNALKKVSSVLSASRYGEILAGEIQELIKSIEGERYGEQEIRIKN